MKTISLLENVTFREASANSEPLYVDAEGRILRFALKPGQTIAEHNAPRSPFYAVVLKGNGLFSGEDGVETKVGPNTLLVFNPKENHSIRALDEEFVFVGFLHGVEGARPEKTGGILGRATDEKNAAPLRR